MTPLKTLSLSMQNRSEVNLSVITVVRNEEVFIGEMIRSLVSSTPTFIGLELIIVDDGSTDKTMNEIQKVRSLLPKSRVLKNTKAGKVNGTFLGLSVASGEWIKFVDGDDVVDFRTLAQEDFELADAFYHDFIELKSKQKRYKKTSNRLAQEPKLWIKKLRTIPKAMFFAKKRVFASPQKTHYELLFEDFWINYNICLNADKIHHKKEALYVYRQHDGNFYGNGFLGQKTKIMLMGKRLVNATNILESSFPDFNFDQNAKKYAEYLVVLDLLTIFSLWRSPYFFTKALYYLINSVFPKKFLGKYQNC